jgi:hypothetical protein
MKRYRTTRRTQKGVRRPIKVQRYYQGRSSGNGTPAWLAEYDPLRQDDILTAGAPYLNSKFNMEPIQELPISGARGILQFNDAHKPLEIKAQPISEENIAKLSELIETEYGKVGPESYTMATVQPDYQRSELEQAVDDQNAAKLPDDGNSERKPTIPEVIPLIREYYAKSGNGAGGSLHIVLEDGNLEDRNVDFCIDYARSRDDADGVLLAQMLRRMTRAQRSRIYIKGWD